MSEKKFWRTYPRKLKALLDVHVEINSTEGKGKRQNPEVFIDQIQL